MINGTSNRIDKAVFYGTMWKEDHDWIDYDFGNYFTTDTGSDIFSEALREYSYEVDFNGSDSVKFVVGVMARFVETSYDVVEVDVEYVFVELNTLDEICEFMESATVKEWEI